MIRKRRATVLGTILLTMSVYLVGCNVTNNEPKAANNENHIKTEKNNNEVKNEENKTSIDNQMEKDNDNENQQEISDDNDIKNQEALAKLLPNNVGYNWIYNGFVEYAHQVTLKTIEKKDNKLIYTLEGEVEDVSGGESKADFSIKQIYIIEDGELIQEKEETMMMDSNFDSIVIIQTPLEIGNTWNKKIEDKEGTMINLKSFIKDIEEVDGKKVYTIRYEDENSNYYEERKIEEGIGTINFTKLYKYDEDEFEIGYSIYKSN